MSKDTRFICSKMFTDLNIKFPYESIKNCCKSCDTVTTYDEINHNGIDPFYQNSDHLARKADMLFMNRLPERGCQTCTKTEPNSLFRTWNEWSDKKYDDDTLKDLYWGDHLKYYELVLSSSCDLKCVYCGSKDSSSWALELNEPKREGKQKWIEKTKHRFIQHLENKVWDPREDYQFIFSGGEPTYNLETIEFIEKVVHLVKTKRILIGINTNLNSKPKIFEKFMNMIDNYPDINFAIYCSFEDIGERCEAIRSGLDWDRAMKNFDEALKRPNAWMQMMPTPNLYSLPNTHLYVEYFVNKMKDAGKFIRDYTPIKGMNYTFFSHNMVQEMPLSPMSMPESYKNCLTPAIEFCYNNKVDDYAKHLTHVQNLIGSRIDDTTADKIETKFNYFKLMRPEYDWDNLFPHVHDIIGELRKTHG